MKRNHRLTLPLLTMLVAQGQAVGSNGPVVNTESGRVQGVVQHGAEEFRGLPYAAPPTGSGRWSLPQSVQPWTGVRNGAAFGAACPQEARFGITERSTNEDCLTLNISAPADRKADEKLPVFVYIHGGAFVGGSTSLYRLDNLAREGRMVVVTPNYRLGVFGFMAHPSFTKNGFNGNYGLEDQRFALAWVKRNIAQFGGDTSNVTVAGESTGAGSICMHLATPERSQRLFDKAMILSAGCFSRLKTQQEVEDSGLQMAKDVGCGMAIDTLACMRSKDVASWLKAQGLFSTKDPTDLIAISPMDGNRALPRLPRDAVRLGRLVKVPVLMGGARDELRLYVGYAVQAGYPVTSSNYPRALQLFYTDKTPVVARRFPPGDAPAATYGSVLSSFNPKLAINNCSYLNVARIFSQRMPVHTFEFGDKKALVLGVGIALPDPGFELGAIHSAALNYFFPHYSNNSRIDAPELSPASQALANRMVKAVAAFAQTGNPNGAGLPSWPAYRGGDTVMLRDTPTSGAYDAGRYHQCDFWRQLYPADLSAAATP